MIAIDSVHRPVLLAEALENLITDPSGVFVDCTFGGGGHTRAILEHFPHARVIALDRDPEAIDRANDLASQYDDRRLRPVQSTFGDLKRVLAECSMSRVAGILVDLGFSSFQIDDPARGFAFRHAGPLDMRFDPASGISAADFLATAGEEEIAEVLWQYGEERRSRAIARAIVAARTTSPITTTTQLANLVGRIVGHGSGTGHPATRTFQALRIHINGELDQLRDVLNAAVDCLDDGGRLVVIAFHSLEDRIVKQFIADRARSCVCPPEQPICTCDTVPTLRKIGKAVHPTATEQAANPRSRSAIMRVAERLPRPGTGAA